MTLADLAEELRKAGFDGVEVVAPHVFARGDGPSAPEFTAELSAGVLLTLKLDVRAPDAAVADWPLSQPGRLAIVAGETQLTLAVDPASLSQHLAEWRRIVQEASRAAVGWRRMQRPLHGM